MKRYETLDNMLKDFYEYDNKEKVLEYQIIFNEEEVICIKKKWNETQYKWYYQFCDVGVFPMFYDESDLEWAVYDIEGISPLYFSDRTSFFVKKI